MKKLLVICFCLIINQSYAQDIFKETLYAADLVMANRDFISLTEQQAEKIKKIHGQNAADFRSLKWDLDNENKKLKNLLSAQKIEYSVVEKQMDLVLSIENQLKKKQLQTLVAIKNELTESQQAELDILKYSPKSLTNIEDSKGNKGEQGYKSVMSVIASGNQPIFIVKQDKREKMVLNVEAVEPDKINSITVLKGISAWELYGEEGKNGVVILELKKDANFKFD
ncbi:MAG: hypothetical protein ACXIUQ_14730 [Cecembia sp.]